MTSFSSNMNRNFLSILFLITLINLGYSFSNNHSESLSALHDDASSLLAESKSLPTGYYAFSRAHPNAVPPKVRKPPYMFIDAACPGIYDHNSLIPKNNLCGDLNKGFVPRSPLATIHEHPGYPFEIIKNKTLQYLSKTLPHLKNEIDSIPKVARFMKPSQFFEHYLRRSRRSLTNIMENKSNESIPEMKVDSNVNVTFQQQSRHQCSGNAICHALESLREEGPLSKNFLSNVVSAVGNMALEHYNQQQQSTSNNTLNKSAPTSKLNTILTLTQLLSSTLTDSSSSTSSSSSSSSLPPSSSSALTSPLSISSTLPTNSDVSNSIYPQPPVYSPLLSIIDYVQSLQSPKSRKSSDDDGLDQQLNERPQTTCQSSEEYVSPTYARNYQGVWKYVVQIPDEGYFTQTVQQTSCAKAKCDLLEGTCRESPRWVSLLVAEIFYPDVYFPVNQSPEDGFVNSNRDQNTLVALAAEIAKQQQQQQNALFKPDIQHALQQQQIPQHASQIGQNINAAQHFHVMNSNHHNLNKHQRSQQIKQQQQQQQSKQSSSTHQQNVKAITQRHSINNEHIQQQQQTHNELMLANMLKRQDKMSLNGHNSVTHRRGRFTSSDVAQSNRQSSELLSSEEKSNHSESSDNSVKKHCDGFDKIGCYNIRVYYDWFLVNGSCKCHRTSNSGLNGINETIKRIFIGKWK